MRRNKTFRTTVWDPILIVSQIIALQTLYYTSISTIALFTLLISGNDITLDHLFDYREFRTDTVLGWTLGFAWLSNSIVGIYLLVKLIQRAKLVLDFCLTLHFFHLLITSFYSGHLPTTFIWWIINLITCCIMIFGGELYCMKKEMEPIFLFNEDILDDNDSNNVNINNNNNNNNNNSIINKKLSLDFNNNNNSNNRYYEIIPMEEIEIN